MSTSDVTSRNPWKTEGEGKEAGGRGQREGDKYGAAPATKKKQGDDDGVNEARQNRAWDRDGDGDEGATALPLAPSGAERRCKRDAVRGR